MTARVRAMGMEQVDPQLYSGSRRRFRDPRRREKARRGETRIRDPMQHRFGGQWHFTPVVRQISLFFRYYKGFISMDARERRFRLIADKFHAEKVKFAREQEKKKESRMREQVDISFRPPSELPAFSFFARFKLRPEQIL